MSVKLYEGCWGVTRSREVVGPAPIPNPDGTFTIRAGRCRFLWDYSPDGKVSVGDLRHCDIVAVFKTEAEANRKAAFLLAWLIGKLAFAFLVFVLAAVGLSLLLGCANSPVRDYPHGKRCATDGTHKHLTDSTALAGKGKG